MDQEYWLSRFRKIDGCFVRGHIKGVSGKHMQTYIQKDVILALPQVTRAICRDFADFFRTYGAEAVIAPAFGAITLSCGTAEKLSGRHNKNIFALYAEKKHDGSLHIRESFKPFIKNKRILVLEDTVSTGGSTRKVIQCVQQLHGNVVGVGSIFNRGYNTAFSLNVPSYFCICNVSGDSDFEIWDECNCPLCKAGIPIDKTIGHGGDK